jgi:hypothetical protein
MPPGARRPILIVGAIRHIELIAVGRAIREWRRLSKAYGGGRWRKLKGLARVSLPDGTLAQAEVHWYQCHGVGRRELKIKRLLEERQ